MGRRAAGRSMGTHRNSRARRTASTGFVRLLARLDPNPDRAAAEYERLRITLERFFEWRGAWPPEECADETLDRLAHKFEVETIDNVYAYARGIARLVLLEWQRRPAAVPIDQLPRADASVAPAPENDSDDATLGCFDRCLASLADESRALVLDYYVDDRRAKIDNRRRLAQRLGLSESALRNRVHRVRNRLERCIRTCTALAAEIGLEAAVRKPVDVKAHDEE